MKKRLFFQCTYDGTNYSGWQKQPEVRTIQGVIEEKLSMLFGHQIVDIVGCGRTDAGVHAKEAYFHVDLAPSFSNDQLLYKLNNMLPLEDRKSTRLNSSHVRISYAVFCL